MKRPSGIGTNNSKKGGIAEEIDKLKQRREERKNKNASTEDERGGKNQNSKKL